MGRRAETQTERTSFRCYRYHILEGVHPSTPAFQRGISVRLSQRWATWRSAKSPLCREKVDKPQEICEAISCCIKGPCLHLHAMRHAMRHARRHAMRHAQNPTDAHGPDGAVRAHFGKCVHRRCSTKPASCWAFSSTTPKARVAASESCEPHGPIFCGHAARLDASTAPGGHGSERRATAGTAADADAVGAARELDTRCRYSSRALRAGEAPSSHSH